VQRQALRGGPCRAVLDALPPALPRSSSNTSTGSTASSPPPAGARGQGRDAARDCNPTHLGLVDEDSFPCSAATADGRYDAERGWVIGVPQVEHARRAVSRGLDDLRQEALLRGLHARRGAAAAAPASQLRLAVVPREERNQVN